MTVPSGERAKRRAAEAEFAAYVARRRPGEPDDFESLCARHEEIRGILERLRRQWLARGGDADDGSTVDSSIASTSTVELRSRSSDAAAETPRQRTDELSRRRPPVPRYRDEGEIAHGGMGFVLKVWDEDLRRFLAMKVIRGRNSGSAEVDVAETDPKTLGRFLEEAEITGQLEHPGIVPVHDLGVDAGGRVFFTMRLVKGQDLRTIFSLVRKGAENWTQTRALGVLLDVCEAMAYAHSKGVIHRDLKPSNVMVGKYGETYVMDWGLAKVIGREDPHDLRIRVENGPPTLAVRLHRPTGSGDDLDSPLATMDGDVIGTPSYMSPEQAIGRLSELGPASDVYAVGAMLYTLLAGHMPYVPRDAGLSARTVLEQLIAGPPTSLQELRVNTAPELVAICNKAMSRVIEDRYPNMSAMADDLRAFLETRVVKAYRTGATAELRKWIARNRGEAASLAALIVVLIGSGLAVALIERVRTADALASAERIQRLLDERSSTALVREAEELWPVHPASVPAMDHWLEGAQALTPKVFTYRAELEKIESQAIPDADGTARASSDLRGERDHARALAKRFRDKLEKVRAEQAPSNVTLATRDADILEIELRDLERRSAALEQAIARRHAWTFANPALEERHRQLAAVVENLAQLSEPETGDIARVTRRREAAATLRARTLDAEPSAWSEAIASIRDAAQCPHYQGMTMHEQIGLVPLRRNPATTLWEFWHVSSGKRPVLDERGDGKVDSDTGIVLVLIPGGSFAMGCQRASPDQPNFDANAKSLEGPVRTVELAPYFIAKHEMTQAQWIRAAGTQPSEHAAGLQFGDSPRFSRTHPVEHVSWDDCHRALHRWCLQIPTEAQWERAARGGTQTPYWSGVSFESLQSKINFADKSVLAFQFAPNETPTVDDGYPFHAPVGSFAPNPFGLYDVIGNVSEWCRDWFSTKLMETRVEAGDGEIHSDYSNLKAYRGGSSKNSRPDLRIGSRYGSARDMKDEDLGVRPSRALEN